MDGWHLSQAGGYEGGRVFRMFGGQHWKRTACEPDTRRESGGLWLTESL